MSTDKRVRFDFEVDFSNGGGIQGQDFRLDIDGDYISDEDLADYIVQDLRLLMVGDVRILNKEIISERHKRTTGSAAPDGRGSRFFAVPLKVKAFGTFPVRAYGILEN
jgi:arylformamidase